MASDIQVKRLGTIDSTNRYVREEAAALWSGGYNAVAVVTCGPRSRAGIC